MKVYVVYGNDTGDFTTEFYVFKVFTDAEKAVDYAIEKAKKAFDEHEVEERDRFCRTRGDGEDDYDNDSDCVFGIYDIENYGVEIFVMEQEVED